MRSILKYPGSNKYKSGWKNDAQGRKKAYVVRS